MLAHYLSLNAIKIDFVLDYCLANLDMRLKFFKYATEIKSKDLIQLYGRKQAGCVYGNSSCTPSCIFMIRCTQTEANDCL